MEGSGQILVDMNVNKHMKLKDIVIGTIVGLSIFSISLLTVIYIKEQIQAKITEYKAIEVEKQIALKDYCYNHAPDIVVYFLLKEGKSVGYTTDDKSYFNGIDITKYTLSTSTRKDVMWQINCEDRLMNI